MRVTNAPSAVGEQHARHAAEGRDGEAFAAGDEHVLAQLHRAAGDADHHAAPRALARQNR